jgi:tetratricopeptide (TPR) repeat protein
MRVDYLLEGSVRRSGNRIRVTAKLIQVNDQTQVWMSHYDGELAEIFEVQSDVAGRVARSLTLELLPEDASLGRPATRNPAAYELYLRACHLFGRGTDEARREALARFHETIALDPEYALAHARLANCYISLAADNVMPPEEAYAQAKTAARRALELDESLAPAHAYLALVAMAHDWSWQEAQSGFRRAVDLDPNSAYAHGVYSTFLAAVGRSDDAVAEARRALELDPRSAGRSLTVGTRLLFARRYDAAIDQFQRTLELDPQYDVAHYYIGKALLEMGRHDEAVVELERAYVASGSPTDLAELARGWAKAGATDRSREALAQLAAPGGDYVSPTDLAKVHEALGENEAALDRLEQALDVRAADVVFLQVDPDWDGLRAEPRFLELLQRIGLPIG